MDPDIDMTPEFDKRIDKIVEEMRALNISSITIVQDSVSIGVGTPEPRLTKAEKAWAISEYDKCFGTAPRSDEYGR